VCNASHAAQIGRRSHAAPPAPSNHAHPQRRQNVRVSNTPPGRLPSGKTRHLEVAPVHLIVPIAVAGCAGGVSLSFSARIVTGAQRGGERRRRSDPRRPACRCRLRRDDQRRGSRSTDLEMGGCSDMGSRPKTAQIETSREFCGGAGVIAGPRSSGALSGSVSGGADGTPVGEVRREEIIAATMQRLRDGARGVAACGDLWGSPPRCAPALCVRRGRKRSAGATCASLLRRACREPQRRGACSRGSRRGHAARGHAP